MFLIIHHLTVLQVWQRLRLFPWRWQGWPCKGLSACHQRPLRGIYNWRLCCLKLQTASYLPKRLLQAWPGTTPMQPGGWNPYRNRVEISGLWNIVLQWCCFSHSSSVSNHLHWVKGHPSTELGPWPGAGCSGTSTQSAESTICPLSRPHLWRGQLWQSSSENFWSSLMDFVKGDRWRVEEVEEWC